MRLIKKVNLDNVIYAIKVFIGIMILMCFFAAHQSIQIRNVEKYKSTTPLLDLRATPNSTSAFMLDDYAQGATSFEVKGANGRFLGADQTHSILAVNVTTIDGESKQPRDKLKVFDTRSRTLRHETHASGCSNISSNKLTYCQNEDGSHITAFHALSGKRMFSFTTPNPDAKLYLLGSLQHADVVVARNSEHGPATTNVLYSISGNEVRWSKHLHPDETCNVINQHRTVLCQQPATGSPDATTLRAFNVADGLETANKTTKVRVTVTSDGWIEHPDASAKKEYQGFNTHGRPTQVSKHAGDTAFFPHNSGTKLGNSEALVYPTHSIAEMEPDATAIISAYGTPIYRSVAHNDDGPTYATLENDTPVLDVPADEMLSSSHNGRLVLLQKPHPEAKGDTTYQIFDAADGKTVFEVKDIAESAATIVNGKVAIIHTREEKPEEGKLTILLPKE